LTIDNFFAGLRPEAPNAGGVRVVAVAEHGDIHHVRRRRILPDLAIDAPQVDPLVEPTADPVIAAVGNVAAMNPAGKINLKLVRLFPELRLRHERGELPAIVNRITCHRAQKSLEGRSSINGVKNLKMILGIPARLERLGRGASAADAR
jgi:hypothetical protein